MVGGPAQYGTTALTLRCTKGDGKPGVSRCMPGAGLSLWRPGRPRLTGQPSSRTGENPPYGMSGGIEETSASFEARSAPRSYPTARLQGQAKGGGEESGSQFGHQLLAGVSLIAPALAPEAPVQARGVTSPVQCLMPEGRVIALGIAEGGERGHADVIGCYRVEGLCAPMPDVSSGCGEECLRVGDRLGAGQGRGGGLSRDRENLGQALNLANVAHGVGFQEANALF